MTAAALAAVLRGDAADPIMFDGVMRDAIREQGVAPLIYRALRDRGRLAAQIEPDRHFLLQAARDEAAVEAVRHAETVRVLNRLHGEGIRTLVFKGTALAYTCYSEPWLRPRLDTDVLIAHEDVTAVCRAFQSMACVRAPRTSGELVTHQATYISTRQGVQTPFDIHWRLADPQAFAEVFSFEELYRDRLRIPGLGAAARTFGNVHALLTACVHRVAHHYDREILLFLYDIDLLARRLGAEEWGRVAAIAAQKQICAVTARGLDLAARLFGTPVPSAVAAALAAGPGDEPTAAYLRGGLRKVDLLWSDLRALKGRRRLELVWEHLFPPRRFLRESYGPETRLPVPILYVHRIFRGAYGWFRPLR